MKKRLLTVAVLAALPIAAQASMPIGSFGSATTLGQGANPQTLNSTRYNPAAGYLVIDHAAKEKVRFGYWSQFGGSIEFGKADNFKEDIDKLKTKIDELKDKPSIDGVNSAKADFDTVLVRFGQDGSMKLSANAAVPGFPLVVYVPQIGGAFSLDASFGTVLDVSFLDSELRSVPVGTEAFIDTASAVYLKNASIIHLSAGYSQPVWRSTSGLSGLLVLGGKLNYYGVSLTKQVAGLMNTNTGDSMSDVIKDEISANKKSTNAVGVDLGAVWSANYYQLGLTGKNLNSPKFSYGELGSNCDALTGTRQKNCFLAKNLSERISLKEDYVMDPQIVVDGAIYTKNKMWMITGSVDANEINDPVGDKMQYAHAAATFFPKSPILPVARIGIQKNLAGSKLTALNLGFGLFRGVANLDFTYGLDSVSVDGNTVPRQIGMQFSFEETF